VAQLVDTEPSIPAPLNADPRFLLPYIIALGQRLSTLFLSFAARLNLALPKDGSEAMEGPLALVAYTEATKPDASAHSGAVIYVSDGASGAKFQGSNGSSWIGLG
jgi:hypothetical protein